MRAVVTGGAGFIGSHVVELCLKQGWEVIVIDNLSTGRLENLKSFENRIKFVRADISTPDRLWQDEIQENDLVFHLAALADIVPSIEKPEDYYQSNVTATFRLIQECHRKSVRRFVYTASSSCYGLAKEYPTPESSEIAPEYPYALTKKMGEDLVLHWAKLYQLPAVSLRLFNVYGPRSRTSGTYGAMFGVFLAQKLAGKSFTVVGDGTQTRDFTFVTDVARAFLAAAQSGISGEMMNVGSGKTISVNRICELLGGSKVHIPKRPGEPDCTFADISKIKRLLNWQPQVSIEEGVKILLSSIDYWKEAPVWEPAQIAEATNTWFKYLSRNS